MDQLIDNAVSNAFGITPDQLDVKEDTINTYPSKPNKKDSLKNEVAIVDENKLKIQKNEDFNYARETLHSTIDQGNDALVNLVHFANNSGGPQAYKEVAAMMKSMAQVTDTLLKLHESINSETNPKGIGAGDSPKVDATQQNATTINNYHTGTTKDIMESLDDEDDEDIWADTIIEGGEDVK